MAAKLCPGDGGRSRLTQTAGLEDSFEDLLVLHNCPGGQVLEFEKGHEIGEFGMQV
jgi:hypothetical protein